MKLSCLLFMIVALVSQVASAREAVPDLSGSWHWIPEQSRHSGSAEDMHVRIRQEGSEIAITLRTVEKGKEEDQTWSYQIGSDDNHNVLHGAPMKSSVKWEHDTLVMDSLAMYGEDALKLTDRWTLSADRSSLTWKERHQFKEEPAAEDTVVFTKEPESTVAGATTKGSGQAADQIVIPAGMENAPAEQVFKNIQILRGKPASRLPAMMAALNGLLGVDCAHCHVDGAWEKEPPTKVTARSMFGMIKSVNHNYFGDANAITCWTCHRGTPKPGSGSETIGARMQMLPTSQRQTVADLVAGMGDASKKPAREVLKNIEFFKDMPADRLLQVMNVFTIVLGTDCAHCHVPGEWAKDDKPAKKMARKMLAMVGDVNQQLFPGAPPKVACWTCHQGATKPESLPK